jgi:hypothetical protein
MREVEKAGAKAALYLTGSVGSTGAGVVFFHLVGLRRESVECVLFGVTFGALLAAQAVGGARHGLFVRDQCDA